MSTAADYDRAINQSRRDFATAVRVALNGDLDGLATHPPLVQEVILGLIGQQPTPRSCPD